MSEALLILRHIFFRKSAIIRTSFLIVILLILFLNLNLVTAFFYGYKGAAYEVNLSNVYEIDLGLAKNSTYINSSKFYVIDGSAGIDIANIVLAIRVYLTDNLSQLNIFFSNFKDYIYDGKSPDYGLYIPYTVASHLNLKVGDRVNVKLESTNGNFYVSTKIAGILYDGFYSGPFLVAPLNYSKYVDQDYLIVYSTEPIPNATPGIYISGIYVSQQTEEQINQYKLGFELVSILIPTWYIFTERRDLRELLWLFILNGIRPAEAFRKLITVFLLFSFIPIIVFVSQYFITSYYVFPFTEYIDSFIKILLIIPISLLLELYTISSVYSDPYKKLKVGEIE